MKVAVVVQGRLHAFDLTRELLARGHIVTLFTNYPAHVAARFGVPRDHVHGFWPHGLASRISLGLHTRAGVPYAERWLHPLLGRWVARRLASMDVDVLHAWSSVGEEAMLALAGRNALKTVVRGSAHIVAQDRILDEEEQRIGMPLERPLEWTIQRELREYEMADRIFVVSSFARRSFVEQGVPEAKLILLPLGVRMAGFRPPIEAIDARCGRITDGRPLRVLYVGNVSFRKGFWDVRALMEMVDVRCFQFRSVGAVSREVGPLVTEMRPYHEFAGKQPESALPGCYEWADVFLFPTIEDGFGLVLAQAQAAGLPIITTTNCWGPDIIKEGETGFVVPIRRPDKLAATLEWCHSHRAELVEMVHRAYDAEIARDWADVAADFETSSLAALAELR